MNRRNIAKRMLIAGLSTAMLMSVLSGCSSNSESNAPAPTEAQTVVAVESESEVVTETAIELSDKSIAEIDELFETYFKCLLEQDEDGLKTIMVKPYDKKRLKKESRNIQEYQNIKCYYKEGLLDGTYLVYVYNEVLFNNIETAAPSMVRYYVCTNEDGKLYINNGKADGEIGAWIDEVESSDFVQKLFKDVNESLVKAGEADENLQTILDNLSGKTEETESETEAKPEETEATEESQDVEVTEGESKEDETEAVTEKESVKESDQETEETKKSASKKKSYTKYKEPKTRYAQENLNIRKKASADSKRVGKLTAGDKCTVVGYTGDWYVINYKDGVAYIKKDLLGKKKPKVVDDSKVFSERNDKVTATETVVVRKKPSTSAETWGVVLQDSEVTRTGYNSTWTRIKYDGHTGYVSSKYVR